ncbi:MAG TPA: aldehyde dehydrogenase [Coleofasciculaceae cyanobacterium]|jgi:acyl-CoA reductase-like NAD-dependent aldehyde dehydrogenase
MVQAAIENPSENIRDRVTSLVQQQRSFFATGKTKDIEFRIAQINKLKQAIKDCQDEVMAAVHADLNKPSVEAYMTEIGVIQEINFVLKHLRAWAKPKSVALSLEQLPARAKIYPEPLGVALIISPWNYPFQLMISPLVAAIAAGNCALLKPSELAPATSRVIANLIQKIFDPAYVAVVEGGVEVSQAVLAEKFDHIFFTGGTAIGKIVMQAAAQHLTPVTLELGGKSPCIVDADIHVENTAKRIVWGKFINAGQTCVAPDYLLVDRRIKSALLEAMKATLQEFYGDNPATSPDYARIINAKQFDRLTSLLQDGKVVIGGETIAAEKYIAPTVLEGVSWDDRVMQDEIFGPILPLLDYENLEEAIAQINARPKPLALYVFSKNPQVQQQVLQQTSSGGVCINDTIMQIAPSTLPFGGVGESGMGSYHGKAGFDTFSHFKSVLSKPFWLDLPWRYAPYKDKLSLLKRMIG